MLRSVNDEVEFTRVFTLQESKRQLLVHGLGPHKAPAGSHTKDLSAHIHACPTGNGIQDHGRGEVKRQRMNIARTQEGDAKGVSRGIRGGPTNLRGIFACPRQLHRPGHHPLDVRRGGCRANLTTLGKRGARVGDSEYMQQGSTGIHATH